MRHLFRYVPRTLLAVALLAFIPQSYADGLRGARMGARGSAVRSIGRAVKRSRDVSRAAENLSRASRVGARIERNRSGARLFGDNRPAAGRRVLGGLLREGVERRLGDDYGYGHRRGRLFDYLEDRDNERADAYRDAMIADSIVRAIGIIATAPRTHPRYVAPAPPVAVAPTPGHYETRRVLVREGYWTEEQVWVPEYQDPNTGAVIAGHYEVHKRWVPEVYEETQVWVPHVTPVPYR